MKYTDTDLQKLMAEVAVEFSSVLAKAEEESKPKEKEEEKKPIEGESSEDKGVKDQHQQDTSKEEPKGEKMESKEGREEEDKKENSKPSDDSHGEAMDHGYDDEDMEHMHSMYSSMSKPELKAHHDSIRKCMDGMAKDEGMDMSMSEHPAMAKSESDAVVSEITLLKSELEAVKAKSAEEKKSLETAMTAFLTKFVEKVVPAGKAITSMDIIAKSSGSDEKPLQKGEIDAKLMAKAKDLTLAKSDRDLINSYYCGGKNIETVRHLLK